MCRFDEMCRSENNNNNNNNHHHNNSNDGNDNCCSGPHHHHHHHGAVEEAITAEESLLIYCKPVELYNILHSRSRYNPTFLRRCLRYRMKAKKRRRRLSAGVVVFNYRDYSNMVRKTEVTEEFSCPFCSTRCLSMKGLQYHLRSSHDLFNFEFWVAEDYQAVNVSVNINKFETEIVADGLEQQQQPLFFCFKPRRREPTTYDQNEKRAFIQFLELDSPKLATERHNGFLGKDDDLCNLGNGDCPNSYKNGVQNACSALVDDASKSSSSEKDLHSLRHGAEDDVPPSATELIEHVGSSFDIQGASIAKAQSSVDTECGKSLRGSDPSVPTVLCVAKARKVNTERSDSRNRALLLKRQFYHSHRVQPMALEQVMSDRDSEDEVDDEIADFDDRRMLDDFVDVSKDEKRLMHLWNSFVRKQSVLADGHVPWACEAFSKLHGRELVASSALFWCWRLFMIKLWNHGLLDSSTMNNCNLILERCRDEGSDAMQSEEDDNH